METPSFSIVVPTFQRRDVVRDALRAISRIEYAGRLEVIVIVDGSTDGTVEAVEAVDCPFPTTILFQENAGPARARNRGAAEAGGSILLFLDDDMISDPQIVHEHARSHGAGADAVLGHIPLDPASPPGVLADGVRKWAESRAAKLANGAPITLFDLLGGHLSVRREVFDALGGFDQAFTAGGSYGNEDIDFGARLVAAHRIVFNPNAIAWHRYVVTPGAHMRQYFQAGQAAVDFNRKHSVLGQDLFDLFGVRTLRTRFFLRPLASAHWVVQTARKAAVALAGLYLSVPAFLRPVVRKLFFNARDLVYWSGVHSRGGVPRSRSALILCYHAIADLAGDPVLSDYGIAPKIFEKQLDQLLARGRTFISPGEFAALIDGSGRVPANALLLTFDDCYCELSEVARSLLAPRGIRAVAFAVSGMASGTNEWDNSAGSQTLRLLDETGLRELATSGVEVGSHSRTHRPLTAVPAAELPGETSGAASDLEHIRLPRPRFFAYPHGEHDRRSEAAVREAGFLAAFGLRRARARSGDDRYALARVEILARDSGWRFWLKTTWPRASLVLEARHLMIRGRRSVRRRLGMGPGQAGKPSG
jgi:glycosyltransferase involved in cell wall biosynthesis/peptidoglycan/xylan/chitin deacetylase (PgdA/CDA1 family)